MGDDLFDLLSIEVPLEDGAVHVRDEAKRELDIRLLSWGEVIQTTDGTEEFARGAFDGSDPSRVKLMGLEHAAQISIGHDGKPRLTRVPTGKGVSYEDRDDGPHMTFRVSKTQAGDDQLELARDGIVTGASVEFMRVDGGTVTEKRGSRRHNRHVRADLRGVTTTYQPAYPTAQVLAVRNEEENVSETNGATPEAAAPAFDFNTAIAPYKSDQDARFGEMFAKLDAMEEAARSRFELPSAPSDDAANPNDGFGTGQWMSLVLRMMSGERVNQKELETRIVADLVTADNLGVVPEAFLSEMIGIIDPSRPFLSSTRKIDTPDSGMTLNVPVLQTRPTVGIQDPEKEELVSTPTAITSTSFEAVSVGGYGDISIQLLKRSSPAYLSLYVELLLEAYAIYADDLAVDVLLAASGINTGATLDPADGPLFGDAWQNGSEVSSRLTPDTIWMSSDAVRRFINAQDPTTTQPIYGNLAGAFSAAGGAGGTISGLRPVHVPALDNESYDVIVGPSRGFAWAEDGTYTLQVDVPARAGRDVGIIGMLWFMPLYGAAFTRYALSST